MPRIFNGHVHVKIASRLHQEVAQEAVEKGMPISGICSQALVTRRALKNIDPWKAIDKAQKANRCVSEKEIHCVIAKAVKDVRRHRRG